MNASKDFGLPYSTVVESLIVPSVHTIAMICSLPCQNADLSPATTLHVDSFLYSSEEQVDQLCSQLEISRNYCLNCGSWKTLPLSKHSIAGVSQSEHYLYRNHCTYVYVYMCIRKCKYSSKSSIVVVTGY